MDIQLKNIKVNLKLSEETLNFSANLYINGRNVGIATNRGCGASTDIYASSGCKPILSEAEKYFRSLPKVYVKTYDLEYQPTLEDKVNELVEKYLNDKEIEKQKKKLAKDLLNGICYGKLESYEVVYWRNYDLETLLKYEAGRIAVSNKIKEITNKGYTILNTNIPQELY